MALGKGLNSLIPQTRSRVVFRRETGADMGNAADRVWQIPLTDISPNPDQPRKDFSHAELEDLVHSVKLHGILQPITVSEKSDGGYELIAGERRFRASQIAGLPTIPAIVKKVTNQERLELALIENIQRQDLNPIEEAFSFQRLIDEFGLTQQEVSDRVGKSRPSVANTVRLLDLPEIIQKALIDRKISAGKARALIGVEDEKQQMAIFQDMIGEKMNVRDVERSAAAAKEPSRKGSVRRDPNIRAQEELLEERYGSKVRMTQKGEKGTIVFSFYSREELKRLLSELL